MIQTRFKDELAEREREDVTGPAAVAGPTGVSSPRDLVREMREARCLSYHQFQIFVYEFIIANICILHILHFCYFLSIKFGRTSLLFLPIFGEIKAFYSKTNVVIIFFQKLAVV
jgi:hypothetical protein